MIKKFYLFIMLCLLSCPAILGQNEKVTLKGEVVAYIESNVTVPPHSYIPNSDMLIVRVINSDKIKDEFIKVKTEYFGEKSPLPEDIFKGDKWKFKLFRRTDCDSLLIPDNSELQESTEKKDNETWTFSSPSVKFVKSDETFDLPKDKALPCYSFISAKSIQK